jgi:hypothetical protein
MRLNSETIGQVFLDKGFKIHGPYKGREIKIPIECIYTGIIRDRCPAEILRPKRYGKVCAQHRCSDCAGKIPVSNEMIDKG